MNKRQILICLIALLVGICYWLKNCQKRPIPTTDLGDTICADTFRVEKVIYDTLIRGNDVEIFNSLESGREKLVDIKYGETILYKDIPISDIEESIDPVTEENLFSIIKRRDTVSIIQRYYCNQILIGFQDGITDQEKADAYDHLIDTLQFKRSNTKTCPCSNFEVWGKDANTPLSPEDRGRAGSNSVARNGSDEKFLFNSSLNFIVPPPPKPELGSIEDTSFLFTNQKKNASVKIALIDSGINTYSSDFTNLRWVNKEEKIANDNLDSDKNCYRNDIYGFDFINDKSLTDSVGNDINGHGTHIAGIISGANIAKATQVELEIMDLKIFHDSTAELFHLICATNYAIKNDAEIINQSLGFYSNTIPQVLVDVFKKAEDEGILIVCSSGNDGLNNDKLYSNYSNRFDTLSHLPSDINLENVISVGALSNSTDSLWNEQVAGSNYGLQMVDVSAPGEKILSTYVKASTSAKLSGTSMAAGQVTRIAAILKYKSNQVLTPRNTKECLINHANSGVLKLNTPKRLVTVAAIIDTIPTGTTICY